MAEDKNSLPRRPQRRDPYRLTGETFGGRYHLEEFAGMGSFGAVYRALDKRVGRRVAVKILKPDLDDDEMAVARELFQREAQTAGRLMHRHIVAVTDVGEEQDFAYLVMEWLEGRTLEDELRARIPFSPEETRSLLAPIADALSAAHDAGVIHRDIKPSNIYIGRRDRPFVKVLDFGIAKVVSTSTAATASRIAGTASYMSPEQITGSRIDRRTDIYSLGIVLYQMLAGELPFKGESQGHIIQQHIASIPPSLAEARPDLPPALSQVIGRALGKLPEARQQSAQQLYSEFTDALAARSVPQPGENRTPSGDETEVLSSNVPPTLWSGQRIEPPPQPLDFAQQPTARVTGPTKIDLPPQVPPQAMFNAAPAKLIRQGNIAADNFIPLILHALAGALFLPFLSLLAFRWAYPYIDFSSLPKFPYALLSIVLFGLLFGITTSALEWSKRLLFFALGGAGPLLLLTALISKLMDVHLDFNADNPLRYYVLHNMFAGLLLGMAASTLRPSSKIRQRVKAHLVYGAACAVIVMLIFHIYQVIKFGGLLAVTYYYFFEGKFRTWLICAAIGFIIGLITCGLKISYKESVR